MSEYNEEIGSDQGIGMDQILREAEQNTASWKKNDMPGTETLRRMILLADWASREPKRWAAYKMFYYGRERFRRLGLMTKERMWESFKYIQPAETKKGSGGIADRVIISRFPD